MSSDLEAIIKGLEEIANHHKTGEAFFHKDVEICSRDIEDFKQVLDKLIKVYFEDTTALFQLCKVQFEFMRQLEFVLNKCCPEEFAKAAGELDKTTKETLKRIKEKSLVAEGRG